MSCQTLEVKLENGVVPATGAETLPAKAHALLTILSPGPATEPPKGSLVFSSSVKTKTN